MTAVLRRQRRVLRNGGTKEPVSWAAVRAVARHEVRLRYRTLLAIGTAAGLIAAVVVGSVTVARRTATAFDRLADAAALEDARATVFGGDELADQLGRLPIVESSWQATLSVARLDGPGVVYVGVLAGPERPEDIFQPVVLDGRLPDPHAADEVAVLEPFAEHLGLGPGDELRLAFLTPEEVSQFDVGFGEPDGPRRSFTVAGVVRTIGFPETPVLATPAFHRGAGASAGAATLALFQLHAGAAGVDELRAAALDLAGASPATEGSEEFVPVEVSSYEQERQRADESARTVVLGLLALAAVVAVAGCFAAGQALARHHAAGSAQQRVEAAVGMTPRERVAARVLAVTVSSAVAATIAAAGGVLAGGIEPPGASARFEPAPGGATNVAIVLLGALATAVAVTGIGASAARRAGLPDASSAPSPTRLPAVAIPGGPAAAVGVALVESRAALVGAVVGVGGLIAAVTFGASLDRLVETPQRWGWDGDVLVVDANEDVVDRLLADDRVAGLAVLESAAVRLGGEELQAHSWTKRRGDVDVTLLAGRLPAADDEVAVGRRVGDRLDVEIGDDVTASAPGGEVRLRVVGEVIVPGVVAVEPVGANVLLTAEGLGRVAQSQPFEEAMVDAAPETARALLDDLGASYEIEVRQPPADVDDLRQVGRMPYLLGGVLAAIGLAALLHALTTTVRRRSDDLAVARAIGLAPRQVAAAVTVSAVVTSAVGLAVGIPLGLGVGRLLWWAVADATAVATDVPVPVGALVAVVVAVPVVAVAAAARPARRAARLSPALLLRTE